MSWFVKDRVILESEILQNERISIYTNEERISGLKKQIEWNPIENNEIRFFVMSKYPALFPDKELKRIIRTELERFKSSVLEFVSQAKAIGLLVTDTESGLDFSFPDPCSPEIKKKGAILFSAESLKEHGLKNHELNSSKILISKYHKLLGDKVK